jgi:hypothetical protein
MQGKQAGSVESIPFGEGKCNGLLDRMRCGIFPCGSMWRNVPPILIEPVMTGQQGKSEMDESEHEQIQVETPQQNTQFTPAFPAIFLLHRFGVILAANDAAHHYFPFLPLASIYEQKLAQQLAAGLA